jgi:hypothetical protein
MSPFRAFHVNCCEVWAREMHGGKPVHVLAAGDNLRAKPGRRGGASICSSEETRVSDGKCRRFTLLHAHLRSDKRKSTAAMTAVRLAQTRRVRVRKQVQHCVLYSSVDSLVITEGSRGDSTSGSSLCPNVSSFLRWFCTKLFMVFQPCRACCASRAAFPVSR